MKKQGLGLLVGLLIIISIFILSLPIASADKVTEKSPEDGITIKGENEYEVEIECGDGKINYSWEIIEYEDDSITFWFEKENGKDLEVLNNNTNHTNEFSVDRGTYFLRWKNMHNVGSTIIKYSISYQKPPEGCYSATFILSVIPMFILFWAFGYIRKKK